jgi:hypothetical protein
MMSSRKRSVVLSVASALIAVAAGCQLVVDLDGLEDGTCPPGYKSCGPSGPCVKNDNPTTGCNDPGCNPCAPMHALAICSQSLHCSFTRATCIGDWDDCNGREDDGCETDLAHNPQHCGDCSNACPVTPYRGIAGCSERKCAIRGCDKRWADCDGLPGNGCEHELLWSDEECLTCGLPCPEGTHCDQGMCL